jgi:DNA-binding response OmpR family regulator
MKKRHIALIVEDHEDTAADLVQILRSIDCDSIVVDNGKEALAALQKKTFCLVLLDLHIKSDSDSNKGHVEHGRGVLRKIREKYSDHNGIAFWLPVLVVSGFACDIDQAVDIMKDGASDLVQKPFQSQGLSERIRQALHAAERQTHEQCHEPPKRSVNLKSGIVIAIPGDRVGGRRTRVTIADKSVNLTDASLKMLLHLMVAKRNGKRVNKIDMGAKVGDGLRGISVLRNELKQILGDVAIIKSLYHGDYTLVDEVTIGECAVDQLIKIENRDISDLAKLLRKFPKQPKQFPGKS